jgi:hypothetical protein
MNFSFWKKRKTLWITLSSVFVLIIILVVGGRLYFEYKVGGNHLPGEGSETKAFWGNEENADLDEELLENLSNPPRNISLLSGVSYAQSSSNAIIAAIIENHPAARPQMLGLAESPLVIEALAEGGITRYLAFFDNQNLEKVGPIRSARPYFADWSEEIASGFIHAGGSETALNQIANSVLFDIDEANDEEVLFRDFRYLKPHNLFCKPQSCAKRNE